MTKGELQLLLQHEDMTDNLAFEIHKMILRVETKEFTEEAKKSFERFKDIPEEKQQFPSRDELNMKIINNII